MGIDRKTNNSKETDRAMKPGEEIIIMGGGLAGLSAGEVLSRGGRKVKVLERDSRVGGLSKTIEHNGFRFDIGGHRFITGSEKLDLYVKDLLNGEYLRVPRTSQIYMFGKYFDYPLKPANAMFGLGVFTTFQILVDYCKERVKNTISPPEIVSLEDWVVSRFGRKMFDLYFKQYSEKVWGIDCKTISQEWVSERIKGLSLWEAIKNAFSKVSGKDIKTLADEFIYPLYGIGQMSDNLKDRIENNNSTVLTDTGVERINRDGFKIKSVTVKSNGESLEIEGSKFISSIPFTHLTRLMEPAVPDEILYAASKLRFRDILIVTVMLDRPHVTDLTWLYLPEKEMPLGRIHEPKNWSPHMAPEGKTHVVTEFFCFKGDSIWNSSDEELTAITVDNLEKLEFFKKSEVIDSYVVRADKAYPLMDVGYREHYEKILAYMKQFENLHIIGRGGLFRYYNMDVAMESGMETAENILGKSN